MITAIVKDSRINNSNQQPLAVRTNSYYSDLITYDRIGDAITDIIAVQSQTAAERGTKIIFEQEDSFAYLPKIYKRTTNLSTLESKFEQMPYDELTFKFDVEGIFEIKEDMIVLLDCGLSEFSVNIEISYTDITTNKSTLYNALNAEIFEVGAIRWFSLEFDSIVLINVSKSL